MTLKAIRISRLKELARLKGELGTVELGKLIGKKTNQTSDLLTGKAPFGEKVARSIEAHAGLPEGWLDVQEADRSYWPFSAELQLAVAKFGASDLEALENVMRATLRMRPLSHPTAPTRPPSPPDTSGPQVLLVTPLKTSPKKSKG